VVRAARFQLTTELLTKPVPFTVSVNAALPATTMPGESDVIVGAGFVWLIVNVAATEVPPPGAGLNTVTEAEPAAARSLAAIEAWSLVVLTNVVVRAAPFQLTTELVTKPVPFTASVNAALPATTTLGESDVTAGTGLFTAKLAAAEVPPPGAGLNTVTAAEP